MSRAKSKRARRGSTSAAEQARKRELALKRELAALRRELAAAKKASAKKAKKAPAKKASAKKAKKAPAKKAPTKKAKKAPTKKAKKAPTKKARSKKIRLLPSAKKELGRRGILPTKELLQDLRRHDFNVRQLKRGLVSRKYFPGTSPPELVEQMVDASEDAHFFGQNIWGRVVFYLDPKSLDNPEDYDHHSGMPIWALPWRRLATAFDDARRVAQWIEHGSSIEVGGAKLTVVWAAARPKPEVH